MRHTLKLDIWFWRLDASASEIARCRGVLDAGERTRMDRLMFARDQARFAICRSRVRRILGWYVRQPPRDISFATAGRGKPTLEGHESALAFNLSHTAGLACLAITAGTPVGIDIERPREVKDDFVAYALNPAEHSRVMAVEPMRRQVAFFRTWTAKEAYLKALGTGLWQSLKTFDVDVPFESPSGAYLRAGLPRIDDDMQRRRNWQLHSFATSDGCIGALAIAPEPGTTLDIRTRLLGDVTAYRDA